MNDYERLKLNQELALTAQEFVRQMRYEIQKLQEELSEIKRLERIESMRKMREKTRGQ